MPVDDSKQYTTVRFPRELVDKIAQLVGISNNSKYAKIDYTSFVIDAVTEKLNRELSKKKIA